MKIEAKIICAIFEDAKKHCIEIEQKINNIDEDFLKLEFDERFRLLKYNSDLFGLYEDYEFWRGKKFQIEEVIRYLQNEC